MSERRSATEIHFALNSILEDYEANFDQRRDEPLYVDAISAVITRHKPREVPAFAYCAGCVAEKYPCPTVVDIINALRLDIMGE